MKKIEWFATLKFDNVDFLISQKDIVDGGYTADIQKTFDSAGEDAQIFFLDDFVRDRFGFASNEKIVTALKIKADFPLFLVTSVVPKVESLDIKEFKILKGPVGKGLLDCGFVAFRFLQKRPQYLIDVNKIMRKEYD